MANDCDTFHNKKQTVVISDPCENKEDLIIKDEDETNGTTSI